MTHEIRHPAKECLRHESGGEKSRDLALGMGQRGVGMTEGEDVSAWRSRVV